MDLAQFHSILSQKFSTRDEKLRYGIVGLHTCGDLGTRHRPQQHMFPPIPHSYSSPF